MKKKIFNDQCSMSNYQRKKIFFHFHEQYLDKNKEGFNSRVL